MLLLLLLPQSFDLILRDLQLQLVPLFFILQLLHSLSQLLAFLALARLLLVLGAVLAQLSLFPVQVRFERLVLFVHLCEFVFELFLGFLEPFIRFLHFSDFLRALRLLSRGVLQRALESGVVIFQRFEVADDQLQLTVQRVLALPQTQDQFVLAGYFRLTLF